MGQNQATPRIAAAVTVVGGTLVVGGQPVSADSFVVTTLDDVVDANDGELSLREAVLAANGLGGADTISFAPALAGEIVLSSQLRIDDDLQIIGPGDDVLQLRSNGVVLYVYGAIDFELSEVTMTSNSTTVRAPGGADVTLDSVAVVDVERAVNQDGGTVSVVGSRFDNNDTAILADDVSSVSVTDSSFSSGSREAIDVERIGNLSIRDSTFENNGYAIVVSDEAVGETTIDIVDSTFADHLHDALLVQDASGSLRVAGSTFTRNGSNGIDTAQGADMSVSLDDVVLSDNDLGALLPDQRDVSLNGLTVSGNSGVGVVVSVSTGDVDVSNSTFSENFPSGLYVLTAGNVDIRDSSFTGHAERGLFVTGGEVALTDLVARENEDGIQIYDSDSVVAANVTASDNLVVGMIVTAADVQITSSEFSDNGGTGLYTESDDGNVLVRSVVASNNGTHGVASFDGTDSLVVENLTAIDNAEVGLYALGAANGKIVVSDSVFVGGRSGVIVSGYNESTIDLSQVSVSNSERPGMYLVGSTSISLADVEVTNSGDFGVSARVFDADSDIELSGVTIAGSADGALRVPTGTVSVVNSTITGNGFDGDGATVSFGDEVPEVSIAHSTITGNTLGRPSAEAFCPYGCPGVIFRETAAVSIEHSIVTGNVDESDVDGLITIPRQAPPAAVVTHSVIPERQGPSETNVLADDPGLAPLAANGGFGRTMLPLPGSPALEAGDVDFAGLPATDQRGLPRAAGVVDIGAVEVQGGLITAEDVSVVEGLGTVDVVLTRFGDPDTAVTVDVATVDGTAEFPGDFGAVVPVQVSWLPGEVGDKTVSVPIVVDDVIEGPETFAVVASSLSPIEDVSAASATVTIRDAGDVVSSLSPARFVDTRDAGSTLDDRFEAEGKRLPDSEYVVEIAGRGGVPVDAKAVVINVTAVGADGVGFVTVHPCLGERPLASSLNYTSGVNLANEIIAPLSASGEVCLYTSEGAHLLVDVVGYVGAESPLVPLDPARYLDTRANGSTFDGVDQRGGRRPDGSEQVLTVAGRGGVPADAVAVIVNVTAVRPDTNGFVTVHPCEPSPPNASSLNYVAGVNRANELIASVNDDGDICLFTSAATDLLVDVVGYVPAGTALSPIAPARFMDTRPAGETIDGQAQREDRRAADSEYVLQIAGRPSVPADATAAVMNVTAVGADGVGFITAHPCVDPRPNASSLNFVAGVNGANELVALLDDDGQVCLYTSERTHLIVDIVAYIQ